MKHLSAAVLLLASISAFSQNTFTTINSIFQSKCVSCHGGGSPAGGLDLSGTETQIYNRLVEVAPANTTAAAKGDMLIDKGYPERSFLLRKVAHGLSDDLLITAGEGNDEPNGMAQLSNQEIELIRQWIIRAAPQSGNVVDYQQLISYYTVGGRPKIARPAAPPAGQGYQIHFGPVFWDGGEESEYFKKYDPRFSQAIDAYKFELFMNAESHHFIIRQFRPGEEQSVSDGLEDFNTDAFNRDFVNAWQRSADLELPIGTAFFWDQNTVFDLNYHLKNYNANEILPGEFYLNVWSRPRGASTIEMHAELIPYLYLYIPANNQNVSFSDDVRRTGQNWNIWMLSTHTHKYGVDYDIFLRNSNGSQGAQQYEGHYNSDYTFNQGFFEWQHPTVRRFSPLLNVNMSNGLIHKATYINTGSNAVTWGFTTAGEMMLMYVQYTTQSVNYKPPINSTGGGGCNPVTLTTDGGLQAYQWSNGETTESIIITQSGTYTVTVTDGSGSTYTSDPVTVSVNAASVNINNGNDPGVCSGQAATLNAGNASSYSWSTGATTPSITVNIPGTYNVTITDANGCTASDVAEVSSAPGPVLSLINASACDGQNAVLDAGNAGAVYLWSTGASSQSISVSSAGNYYVTVTDGSGCSSTDVATVTIHPLPSINLEDVTVCSGSSATLDAGNAGAAYAWSTGAISQTISVSQLGIYSVTVTSANGCLNTDQAILSFGTNLSVNIPDKNVCDGESIMLDAGFEGATYVWSTGATSQTIMVSASGTYSVTVADQNGCNGFDNATVTVVSKPVADGGEDKIICPSESVDLIASGGVSYLWSTGAATGTITVNQAGSFDVTVTAANGCQASDKVQVDESQVLTGSINGYVNADAGSSGQYIVNNNTGSVYDWQVSNGNIVFGQGSASVEVNWEQVGTGILSVTETNADGCTGDMVSLAVNVGATAIAAVDNNSGIKIFPSPASSFIKIEFSNPEGKKFRLSMFDIAGKTVKAIPSVSGSELIISRENLMAGVYFIELKGETVMRGKVVIAE